MWSYPSQYDIALRTQHRDIPPSRLMCRLHISAATAGLTSTGWICKYDRGRLTAILCGIWCVVMLITASRHFHLSKFSTARWYIPRTYPSLHPHLSPICFPLLCLIYLRGRCSMKQQCCRRDLRLQPPSPPNFCQSQFIILLISLSLHPSISLAVYLFIYGEEGVIRGRDGANVGKCNIPPFLSMLVNHFISLSHVDSVRGGCEERISFCWWNPVVLIATSHHLCPAGFIISWCCAGPLLSLLLFLSVSLLLDPSLKNECNIVLWKKNTRFIFDTWLKMSTCEVYIFTFESH